MALYGWNNKKRVEKFIAAQPNPDETRKALEKFYDSTPSMHNVRVDKNFLIIETLAPKIMRSSDVVWVYHHQTKIKYMGLIPTGSTHAILIHTADGQQHSVSVATGGQAKNLLNFLFTNLPVAAFGYNDKLVELWQSKDEDKFSKFYAIGLVQHARKESE